VNWPRLPRWTKKLGLSLLSLVIALGMAELLARATEPGPYSLWDRRPYARDAVLPQVHRPGFRGRWDGTWYEINARGMRGPEFEPRFSADELRVLAIGDSCTFGKGVLERETWPRQLERRLAAELGPDATPLVANLGVNGYSGKHYARVIELQGPRLRPQLIVVGYNINDFPNVVSKVDSLVFQGKQSLRSKLPGDLRDLLGRTALFRWMRAQYYAMNRERHLRESEQLTAEIKGDLDGERLARESERLGQIAAGARACGAEVLVFLFPFEGQVYMQQYDHTAVDWLARACAEHGVAFVDMVEPFRAKAHEEAPPRALFLRGDRYHPRPEGYAIVAENVLVALRANGWLPGTH
jgi:lysophospholipase L1-like esterase